MSNRIAIVVDLDANGVMVGAKQVTHGLDAAAASTNKLDGSLKNAAGHVEEFNQRLFNVVAGLQFMKRNVDALLHTIGRGFAAALKTSSDFEVAMVDVSISMGKIGKNFDNPMLVDQFDEVTKKVNQLGRDTEFTSQQAAEAFARMRQGGMKHVDTMKDIDSVMAFSSATRGTVGLAEASELLVLSQTGLGIAAGQGRRAMDLMVRTMSNARIKGSEFIQVMRSMAGASADLKNTSAEARLAVVATMVQTGDSAAQAGNKLNVFARSLNRVLAQSIVKSRRGGRKRKALAALGVSPKDIIDETTGMFKSVIDVVETMGGKVQAKVAAGMPIANAKALLQAAFGPKHFADLMTRTEVGARKLGHTSLRAFSDFLGEADGEAQAAQELFLSTWEGKVQVFTGSVDIFMKEMGDLFKNRLKPIIDSVIGYINAATEWVTVNKALAGAFLGSIAAVAIFLAAISAAMGIIITMKFTMMALGVASAEAAFEMSAMATMTKFFRIGLIPFAAQLLPIVVLFGKLAIAAYLLKLAWQSDLGGIRTWAKAWGKDIADVVDGVSEVLSGRGIPLEVWNKFSKRAQRLTMDFFWLKSRVEQFGEGLKAGFMRVWSRLLIVLELGLSVLKRVLSVFKVTNSAMHDTHASFGAVKDDWLAYGSAVGGALAALIPLYVAYRTMTVLISMGNVVLFVANVLTKILTGAFWLLHKAVLAINWAVKANPFVRLVIFVIAAGSAIHYMHTHMVELNQAVREATDGFANFGGILAGVASVLLFGFGGLAFVLGVVVMKGLKYLWGHMPSFKELGISLVAAIGFGFLTGLAMFMLPVIALPALVVGVLLAAASRLYDAGKVLMEKLAGGIKAGANFAVEATEAVVKKIRGFFNASPAKWGPLAEAPPELGGTEFIRRVAIGVTSAAPALETAAAGAAGRMRSGMMGTSSASASSPGTAGAPGMPGAAGAGAVERQGGVSVHIGAVQIGDVRVPFVVDDLGPEQAERFMTWIVEGLGGKLEEEMNARGMG